MASDFSLRHAAHIIKNGGVIAYPTDTIYGLGCNPYNADAVAKINQIKQRPLSKQFILLASNLNQLQDLLTINKQQRKKISDATEPTSWVIQANQRAPAWLTDKQNNIAIRISQNEIVKKLCVALGHAIISTSANPSGKAPARNSLELHHYFHYQVDKILATQKNISAQASKIIRLCDNHVIRQ